MEWRHRRWRPYVLPHPRTTQVHLVEGGDHGLAVRGAAAKQGRGAGAKKGGAGSETAGEAAGPLDLALGAVARWMKVGGQVACTGGIQVWRGQTRVGLMLDAVFGRWAGAGVGLGKGTGWLVGRAGNWAGRGALPQAPQCSCVRWGSTRRGRLPQERGGRVVKHNLSATGVPALNCKCQVLHVTVHLN